MGIHLMYFAFLARHIRKTTRIIEKPAIMLPQAILPPTNG